MSLAIQRKPETVKQKQGIATDQGRSAVTSAATTAAPVVAPIAAPMADVCSAHHPVGLPMVLVNAPKYSPRMAPAPASTLKKPLIIDAKERAPVAAYAGNANAAAKTTLATSSKNECRTNCHESSESECKIAKREATFRKTKRVSYCPIVVL